MSEKLPIQMAVLPFSEADLVGPNDRPKPEWQVVMYRWNAVLNSTVKSWLGEGATNGILRALHLAPKPNEGVIYAQACSLEAPKAHMISLSQDHRTGTVSLYTPLLTFSFKRAGDDQKVIFQCNPIEVGDKKILAIKIAGYQVVDLDRDTKEQVQEAEQQATAAAQQMAVAEDPQG
jgi:hypothetical protein